MIPDEKNLTPMMKQYLQVKSEAPKVTSKPPGTVVPVSLSAPAP